MKIKDLILGLVVSVVLFPACQPEEVLGPASLKSTQENVEVDMNGGEATFVIKATRDWTATVSPEDSGFEVFPLSGKGTNDPQTITVKAEANKGRVRSASITFTADGTNPLKVTVVQNGEKGEIYPISEIRAYEEGAQLPVAKMKVLLLSDFSLGNVAQKNLYVQDATGGLQIRLSAAHEFNQGDSLLIDLDGAVISQFNGLKQVSINNSKISRFDEGKPLVAKEVSVADFMSGAYEGQYISLNDVQVVEEELTYKLVAFDESTNVMVESKRTDEMPSGKRFYIYSYHDSSIKNKTLAETQVPQGAGTIKGIASVSGDKMQLVLTSLADIEGMTGERFEPASFVKTDANNYRVNGDAGSVKITVESNTSWTLEKAVDADWLTLSQTSGTGNAEVIVTYQAYDSDEERTAELTFICENGQKSVNIVQKKVKHLTLAQFAELDDDQYKSTFYRISGTIEEWYTTTDIKEAQSIAEGYFKITDENGVKVLVYGCRSSISSAVNDFGTLGLEIGDIVTVEGTKYSYKDEPRARASYLVSYQKAPAFVKVDQREVTARASATFAKITVKSNTVWTVSTESEWIKAYTQSGEKTGEIEVTFDKNTSADSDRTAVIVISSESEGVEDVVVTLIQTKQEEVPEEAKVDRINAETSGVSALSNGYKDWSMQTIAASYAGQSNGGKSYIQLRSTNNNSGIVSTVSGGKVRKVEVTFTAESVIGNTAGRAVDVYVSNTAYTATTDLYDTDKQGTKIASFVYQSNENLTYSIEITEDYEYVGLRSKKDAIYIESIEITWE